VGCIWSSFIEKSASAGIGEFLKRYGPHDKKVTSASKIISVFDTTFIDGIGGFECQLEDGIKFYADMLKLLEENPDVFLIIKEKKPSDYYAKKDFLLYSTSHPKFVGLLKCLAGHPRALVAGSGADSSEIIRISDLVITYAFSSPTLEALGAGKKALFYAPQCKFGGGYFEKVPYLVAYGYEELKKLVSELLYGMSDAQYDDHLEKHVRGTVEDYLDSRGLIRFREMLARKPADVS
jgi:hypothetical protein